MPLASGTRLGPYEIQSAIGAGGMGEVYKARDTRLDCTVAIKVLPSDVSGDPERRARFEREAKTIAGLNHSHICVLHDVGDHDGAMFLVMEHLTGQTLAERLEKGPLPLQQALTIATEIADALSAAHRQGVIHRDLKPANVMLTKSGAKLLDFGLAKLTGHGEQPAAAMPMVSPLSEPLAYSRGLEAGRAARLADSSPRHPLHRSGDHRHHDEGRHPLPTTRQPARPLRRPSLCAPVPLPSEHHGDWPVTDPEMADEGYSATTYVGSTTAMPRLAQSS